MSQHILQFTEWLLGHGIPIVVKEYGEKAYSFSQNMVTVTIPFNKAKNTTPECGVANRVVNLTARETIVINKMKEQPTISKNELISLTGIPKTSLDRILVSLKEKGFLERVGSDKTDYWKVIE